MSERLFFYNPVLDTSKSGDAAWPGECEPAPKEEANLIGSLCDDGQHMPVIDVDLPARLVPSSTEGHFHLYIDKPMTLELYLAMLDGMALAGVVEQAYVQHVRERGMSLCRPEWVRKPLPQSGDQIAPDTAEPAEKQPDSR